MTYAKSPQNQPRYTIRVREREQATHPVWNARDGAETGRRRSTRWGRWRSVGGGYLLFRFQATEALERVRTRFPLSDCAIFFGGRRVK